MIVAVNTSTKAHYLEKISFSGRLTRSSFPEFFLPFFSSGMSLSIIISLDLLKLFNVLQSIPNIAFGQKDFCLIFDLTHLKAIEKFLNRLPREVGHQL